MADGFASTIALLRKEVAALHTLARDEFEHLSTALGDVLRDLDHIKSLLAVRKADKRGRRAVHRTSRK